MATITTFPVGRNVDRVIQSISIPPMAGGQAVDIDMNILSMCHICGVVKPSGTATCPKCGSNMSLLDADTSVTTQQAMAYMDTLRAALTNAGVPVADDYDMALAA